MPKSETVKPLLQYDHLSRKITVGEIKVNVLLSEIPRGFGFVGGDVVSVNGLVITVKWRNPSVRSTSQFSQAYLEHIYMFSFYKYAFRILPSLERVAYIRDP